MGSCRAVSLADVRLAALIAVTAVAAACSQPVGGQAESSQSSQSSQSSRSAPTGTATTTAAPSTSATAGVPGADASLGEVIGFIEAGTAVDAGTFHVAFRDGVTTRLGDDIAFTAPSGAPHSSTQCVSGADGALTCLVDLTAPAPRPPGAEGVWKAGWISYPGTSLQIGALRGDPGPFANGTGADLAAGQSLSFGDDRCRSAAEGLVCVNYAHRSAVRISADGVIPYGCLQPVSPPPDVGAMFGC